MDQKNGNPDDKRETKPRTDWPSGKASQVIRQNECAELLNRIGVTPVWLESDFEVYQDRAARTSDLSRLDDMRVATSVIGLCGETGEVADLLKKHLSHGHDLDRNELVKELGDVLWYLSDLCLIHGISLQDVADQNLIKLEKRYPNGFTAKDSINRTE